MQQVEIPTHLTITWLREMYLKRAISPAEVVEQIVSRAGADADMNIWITPPTLEQIRPYLQWLDGIKPENLPLWGIPFAVKDNIDVSQMPTTAACPAFRYMPQEHATVVRRLIAFGAIPLGKTNLDQFATGLVGARSPYGETMNALRRELISGGSSGGSAVAVARGQAAFALGTDTAGSGRVPAALNGLIGWKPSVGAWPTQGVVPASASLDCVTVFTHSLEDALAVDEAARGEAPSDPWSRDIPRSEPKRPERLCLPKEPLVFYGPFADDYRNAWNESVEKLRALSIPIEYIDTDLFAEAAALLYDGPWVAERWAGLGSFLEEHPGAALPVTEQILRSGQNGKYDAASAFAAMHTLQKLKPEAKRLLQDAVLVMPTCGGTWKREELRRNPIGANSDMGRYTNHCNLLDLCAVSVPSAMAGKDLPFGITFFATSGMEGMLVEAASLFEKKTPTTPVAVCGLHMRGFPLEKQMRQFGAYFVREAATAEKYLMYKLPTTPAKPGLVKTSEGGGSVKLEIWEMPLESFGAFASGIPHPLGIGKVELLDGTEVPGFVCEAYAAAGAEDITALGGWRQLDGDEVALTVEGS